jgi:phosphate transport system permease protein
MTSYPAADRVETETMDTIIDVRGTAKGEGAPPPDTDEQGPPEIRRTTRGVQQRDMLPVAGALAASLSLTAVVYFFLEPWSGVLGFIVVAYVLFIALYGLLVSMDGGSTLVKDRIAAAVATSLAMLMLVALVVVVSFALWHGRKVLSHANFYTDDMSLAGPLTGLEVGGVLHAAEGTLIMITIGLIFTIPLAVVCAVFLSETKGPFTRFVRTIVEAMTALPSVVAGLFVYAAIITLQSATGHGVKSGFAASIALSVMMLPIMIRAADVVLRLVPGNLKEAASALGAPRWRVVWHVVLPTSRSGIMTAIILGTARGIGETSPVLLTAGYTTNFNANPFSGPMVSLPLLTFQLTKSPEPGIIARGFGAATVLMVIVLLLFVTARLIGGHSAGELTRRQARRRERRSARDLDRFAGQLPATTPNEATRP